MNRMTKNFALEPTSTEWGDASGKRVLRFSALLKQEVAALIQEANVLPDLSGELVTVVEARATPDLKCADIFVSVRPESASEGAVGKLNEGAKALRRKLARRVHARYVPRLVFHDINAPYPPCRRLSRLSVTPVG